ncbi:MAG: hypothetical protein WA948_03945, partial [Pontixanthobacter sp.]
GTILRWAEQRILVCEDRSCRPRASHVAFNRIGRMRAPWPPKRLGPKDMQFTVVVRTGDRRKKPETSVFLEHRAIDERKTGNDADGFARAAGHIAGIERKVARRGMFRHEPCHSIVIADEGVRQMPLTFQREYRVAKAVFDGIVDAFDTAASDFPIQRFVKNFQIRRVVGKNRKRIGAKPALLLIHPTNGFQGIVLFCMTRQSRHLVYRGLDNTDIPGLPVKAVQRFTPERIDR